MRSAIGWPSAPAGSWKGRPHHRAGQVTMKANPESSTIRRISARLIPIRRAWPRWASGSLLERMATKTRLSTPSTTSMTTRVAKASQARGSDQRGDSVHGHACLRARDRRPAVMGPAAGPKCPEMPEIAAPGGSGARLANL